MAPGLVARVAFVCAVIAIAPIAHAARRPVAVIDLTASDPAKTLATELYKALLNHGELVPLGIPGFIEALQGAFEDEDGRHLQTARRAKQEAEEKLADLDDLNAARAATTGMQELAYVQPTPEMLGLYAELAFAYGQAQIGLRRPNEASLAFQLAHRLDPARRPDPTQYQPNIVQAYDAAASKTTSAAKLEVKGEGRVWIDGVELGPAGKIVDTTEGIHVVQLTGPDRETRGEQVQVPRSTPLVIAPAPATDELKVRRARIALARARDASERASEMKKLAALLGVGDAVLITKNRDGKLVVQTWRNNEQGFSALTPHRDEAPIDLLTPLAPPSEQPDTTPQPILDPPPVVVEKRWYEKNWVRASIAGGIIAGVVGAILYAQRDSTIGITMDIQAKELK
jgi:hypothetical protein